MADFTKQIIPTPKTYLSYNATEVILAYADKHVELRGAYGRKGKRGGSSKTPTSGISTGTKGSKSSATKKNVKRVGVGASSYRPSLHDEDYPDYNKWSAGEMSKELKKYAKIYGWKSSMKGEGEGEWESKHVKAGGRNGKMGATYFYTIETRPPGKGYGNKEAGLMGRFFFRERDENGEFYITQMDEYPVNLSDNEGDNAFADSIDEIEWMFDKAKDSW